MKQLIPLPNIPPLLPKLRVGDVVEIISGAGKGEIGVFAGIEKTIIGNLLRIELENGTACLVSRYEVKRILNK